MEPNFTRALERWCSLG